MSTESDKLNNHVADRLTITPDPEIHIASTPTEPNNAPRQSLSGNGSSSGNAKRKHGRPIIAIASALVIGFIAYVVAFGKIGCLPKKSH